MRPCPNDAACICTGYLEADRPLLPRRARHARTRTAHGRPDVLRHLPRLAPRIPRVRRARADHAPARRTPHAPAAHRPPLRGVRPPARARGTGGGARAHRGDVLPLSVFERGGRPAGAPGVEVLSACEGRG